MDDVRRWLERSRDLGFLGPGPVEDHIRHASGFAEVVGDPPEAVVDLGSGGGVPGLVLAALWAETRFVLLDSNERRTEFLGDAAVGLGWEGRVEVVRLRAEVAGREERFRGQFPAVVSRSFGSPPVTAECAAPLLVVGGTMVVSEPPEVDVAEARWRGVSEVGMRFAGRCTAGGVGYVVLVQEVACPERYPRREGVPGKRPLW